MRSSTAAWTRATPELTTSFTPWALRHRRTALTGGRGTVIGAFIGAVLIGVLEAGLKVIGVSTNDFYVYIGVMIIAAMALNGWLDRSAARTRTS